MYRESGIAEIQQPIHFILSNKSHLNDKSITNLHLIKQINFPPFQRVCPLSHQGVAAYSQPPLQPSYQRSHQPVSSRHAITLSNETGETARVESQLRAHCPKVHHISLFPPFFLSLSVQCFGLPLFSVPFPPLSRLACTI